ncbi:hypothetical protein PPL_08291 [Heterostelium album PN500]|uniref:BED-type domain-containing protein n=1 Tax=Heterostelium pallidum (strain ATCC 26659 / Pp 5 / PN500) TaxID=670386 RepID=D3BHS7_HETP5|nr:hypothetical protein PPL_08291 [Heterostelium album PN500]EFA78827.1 hypothetical protein PPL_08291 [Heterostelium album PN500]|eukprot:XP_020430951.1 hypothetical protein PPL_08291 [Heterostelium album PN500]
MSDSESEASISTTTTSSSSYSILDTSKFKSHIWKHFQLRCFSDGSRKAVCSIGHCKYSFTYDVGHSQTNSGSNHLKKKHPNLDGQAKISSNGEIKKTLGSNYLNLIF